MKHILPYALIAASITSLSVACAAQPEPVKRPPTSEECDPSDWSPPKPDVDYSLCEEGGTQEE